MIARKKPTKAGWYLISVDTEIRSEKPLLIYYADGRYTFGDKRDIADENHSMPLEDITKYGFWRFFGPLIMTEAMA